MRILLFFVCVDSRVEYVIFSNAEGRAFNVALRVETGYFIRHLGYPFKG